MPISIPTTTGPATSRPQRPILYPLNSGSPRSPPQFSSIPSHPSIRPQMRPPPPTTSSSNQTQTTQTTQTQNQARPKVRPKLDKPIQVIPTKVQGFYFLFTITSVFFLKFLFFFPFVF